MKVIDTDLPGVLLVEPRLFGDERGFFFEAWREDETTAAGMHGPWVQDNHSRSAKGVLRGIHYQLVRPQGKLVRVTSGAAFDVAVDLRRSSPHFGHWTGHRLDAENRLMLWVPPGFGHGFLALSEGTEFLYKCTDYYAPEHERTIAWDDPDLAIDWPLAPGEMPELSAKDAKGERLGEAETYE